ncbi:MAG TPA: tetratricopeptide repeat protein [Pyrinomonadaceae bacterium]|jgi:DNA-binding winged helix-turn-helix (wHTH) protein/TolB-like protein/Flp pilus assembly protein TadD
MSEQTRHVYEFGPFLLDTAERRLLRDGQIVPLSRKAFETLVALVERSGRLVGKDELMRAVWPDSFVEEANLNHHVWALRKALGEGANDSHYIETVPRHGYRFAAGVRKLADEGEHLVVEKHTLTRVVTFEEERLDEPEADAPRLPARKLLAAKNGRPAKWRWLAAVGLLVLLCAGVLAAFFWPRWAGKAVATATSSAAPKSIAVLPLKTIGAGGDEREYLGLGLSDALIARLGNTRRIIVRPTSAVRKYADPQQDPLAAGREQGVDAVLDGTVQQDGNRIRVIVRLMRVSDGASLWAGQFDERLTDIFAVQDSISRQVVEGLSLTLSDEERERLRRRENENVEAYEAYLKGRYFWNKRDVEGFRKAVGYFTRAIEIDPAYARAYAGLADAYHFLGNYNAMPEAEAIPRARAAARKAVEIDESLAEAHASLALILQNYDWDWAGAEKEYRRAIELNPNHATAHHWYGEFLAFMGRFDEGLAEIKLAQRLDPLSLIISTDLGKVYYLARDYDRAIAQYRRTLDMDQNFGPARAFLGLAYSKKGMYREAVAEFHRIENLENDPMYLSWLGFVHGAAGRKDEARKVLARLDRLSRETYVSPVSMVIIYIGLDDKDRAFKWLEKVFDEHTAGPIILKVDPGVDSLRADPRFDDLLRRAGFKT